MAYFGKTYKRGKTENAVEVLEKLGDDGASFAGMVDQSNIMNTFEKNADGSIQFTVLKDGAPVINKKMENTSDADITLPGGKPVKASCTIEENAIKTTLKFPDGKVLHIDRYFEGNTLKTEFSVEGVDLKGYVYYESV